MVSVGLGHLIQRGDALVDGDTGTRVGAIGDARSDVLGTIGDLLVKHGIRVRIELSPLLHGLVPCLAFGGILAALEVFEGDVVGSDETCAATHLDTEVREREATLHAHVTYGRAGILYGIARSTRGSHLCHDVEGHVLGGGTLGQGALDVDAHGLGLALQDGLRSEHLRYLTGADTHSDGAYGSVGRGVGVTTHNGHARQ